MMQAASCSIEFDRNRDTGRYARSQAKEETEAKAVADSENDGIGYRAGKQPQRTVLPTQKVVSEIETAQDIETGSRDADGRDCVVVHSAIVTVRCLVSALRRHAKRATATWASGTPPTSTHPAHRPGARRTARRSPAARENTWRPVSTSGLRRR